MKASKVIMWIGISGLTLQFVGAGVGKFTGAWSAKFSGWGYSKEVMYLVGVLEIVGVVGLFFSKTRRWAAVLLILIMIGAAGTHVMSAEYGRLIHNAVVMGVAGVVVYLDGRSRNPL